MPTIENVTITLSASGRTYRLQANEGYVLHDNTLDAPAYDENDDPMYDENGNAIIIEGFASGPTTCAVSYDFEANPRGFYAKLRSEVPADQIFGGGNNDHEVM